MSSRLVISIPACSRSHYLFQDSKDYKTHVVAQTLLHGRELFNTEEERRIIKEGSKIPGDLQPQVLSASKWCEPHGMVIIRGSSSHEASKPQQQQQRHVKMTATTTEAMELASTASKSLSKKSPLRKPSVEETRSPNKKSVSLENKFADKKSPLTHVLLGKKKIKLSKKKGQLREGHVADSAGQATVPDLVTSAIMNCSESMDNHRPGGRLVSDSPDEHEKSVTDLIYQLQGIQLQQIALEQWYSPQLAKINRVYRESARNLVHYMAFRSFDVAGVQDTLASLGLSSLESCEAHTRASVNLVLSCLESLAQRQPLAMEEEEEDGLSLSSRMVQNKATRRSISYPGSLADLPRDILQTRSQQISIQSSKKMLSNNAEVLLGPSPRGRNTQVMVTLPLEAADDDELMRSLFVAGMNVGRVNCAHNNPEIWRKLIHKVRLFSQLLQMPCRILMDLAGPKLRTGPLKPGPAVLKIKPVKDSLGNVVAPACVWLSSAPVIITKSSGAQRFPDATIPIMEEGSQKLKKLRPGDVLKFKDGRRRSREFHVVDKGSANGVWAECYKTSYVESGAELVIVATSGGVKGKVHVGQVPEAEEALVLKTGDTFVLARELGSIFGSPDAAAKAGTGKIITHPMMTCTLAEVFEKPKAGDPVIFDDGKIEGIISSVSPSLIHVDITDAGDHKGRKMWGEKAINLPESNLCVSGLTPKDAEDLDFVVANADMVALSFVNGPIDVQFLQEELSRRGAENLGIVLKIETGLGFKRLPSILLQAMETRNPVGVMIARGDLAVECGWERLAEMQDQILLICEASHVPTIWATQVLEGLTKSGLPTRPEITDAASASRAECVMLNKGPHIVKALTTLDDILRLEAHRHKKNHMILHPLPHKIGL